MQSVRVSGVGAKEEITKNRSCQSTVDVAEALSASRLGIRISAHNECDYESILAHDLL